jgi:hypothetical protein
MATVRPVKDLEHSMDMIKKEFPSAPPVSYEPIEVKPYVFDLRIGWDTYIVHIPGFGVIGFTDGPLTCRK